MLAGVAAQYILAAAEFVGVVQVLVYVGAVMVLFLFGIMLTRAQIGVERDLNNQHWGSASRSPLMLLVVLVVVRSSTPSTTRRCPTPAARRPPRRSADNVLSNSSCCRSSPLSLHPPRRRHRRHRPGPEGLTATDAAPLNFLLLGAVLFCIGVYGVIARKQRGDGADVGRADPQRRQPQPLAFALMTSTIDGQVFALFVIAVAAAEVGVGLAMVLLVYRNRRSISLDELSAR